MKETSKKGKRCARIEGDEQGVPRTLFQASWMI